MLMAIRGTMIIVPRDSCWLDLIDSTRALTEFNSTRLTESGPVDLLRRIGVDCDLLDLLPALLLVLERRPLKAFEQLTCRFSGKPKCTPSPTGKTSHEELFRKALRMFLIFQNYESKIHFL